MNEANASRLRDKVLELLDNRPRNVTLKDVAAGAGVKEAWLKRLVANDIPEPGVGKVEAVYTYLSGKPLDV